VPQTWTISASSSWPRSRPSRASPGRSPARSFTSEATLNEDRRRKLATRAVHPPAPPEQDGKPVAPVIDPSSTYSFDDTEAFAKASEEKVGAGYVYTRWANPTNDAFEAAVADLEGGAEAEAFSSGMAAISSIFLAFCSFGDRIVSTRQLYGGVHSLFTHRLPRYGIKADLFDLDDFEGIEAALDGAKLLYCETIGNPRIRVADLPRLAEIARRHNVPLVVDNTFASPVLCRPLEHGASIVVHSATKFLGGHHDLTAGIVVSDPANISKIREISLELGPTLAPWSAWLALRGIATMPLRVDRSSDSALKVAKALSRHPKVTEVFYPALDSSPDKERTERLLDGRGGGTMAFDVAGGREAAVRFQDALRLVMPAASLGGTHSLIVHAASVTHTQLSPEELKSAGISEGFCRLSIGLEDPDDILEDLTQALG
jgi:methionine-gamma-lyase